MSAKSTRYKEPAEPTGAMVFNEMVEHPARLIRRSFQIFRSTFDSELGHTGLTPVQWTALATLYSFPGIDVTRLSGLAAVDKTSCGRAIDKLVRKGLVRVAADKADGRQKRLSLTPAGKRMAIRGLPGMRRMRERLLSVLSEQERESFLSVLKTFVSKNNEESRAPYREPDSD